MRLALVNLDTGLFLGEIGWTAYPNMAKTFRNTRAVSAAASETNVKNGAAVMLDDALATMGFIWVTNPN